MTILDGLDFSLALDKKDYKRELAACQARLAGLHQKAVSKKISVILVFEGPDAAGKGGIIRRITEALDARYYKVFPFAAPTDVENAHHYLWRFWNCIGRAGRMGIFDRSWYGRVLVERIERFAGDDEWRRAFAEINDFEDQLIEHGIVLLKFWLQISQEEQLRRFKEREETPYKRWKLERRGLAQPRALGRLCAGRTRDDQADFGPEVAVDPGGKRKQAIMAASRC